MLKAKKLNRQNNQLDAQIWPENQQIYTDMICYIRSAAIPDYEIELVRQDVIEMILSAQSRGETLDTVFAEGYQQFCDDVIAAIPPKTAKQKFLDALDVVFTCLPFLIGVRLIVTRDFLLILRAIVTQSPINWNISVSLGSMISMLALILAAAVVVQLICKNSFAPTWSIPKVVAGTFILGAAFTAISYLGKSVIFTINFFAACAGILILLGIHKLVECLADPA